jgi:hypothetical protein
MKSLLCDGKFLRSFQTPPPLNFSFISYLLLVTCKNLYTHCYQRRSRNSLITTRHPNLRLDNWQLMQIIARLVNFNWTKWHRCFQACNEPNKNIACNNGGFMTLIAPAVNKNSVRWRPLFYLDKWACTINVVTTFGVCLFVQFLTP